jgi:hypothetical protein
LHRIETMKSTNEYGAVRCATACARSRVGHNQRRRSMTTGYLRCAVAAVLLLAAPAAFAKNDVHSANDGVRSSQSLPPMTTPAYHGHSGNFEEISRAAAASPPYCSGNKFGLYNGQGAAHGNGMPFTCGKSPG